MYTDSFNKEGIVLTPGLVKCINEMTSYCDELTLLNLFCSDLHEINITDDMLSAVCIENNVAHLIHNKQFFRYKDETYEIFTGPRGGKYIRVNDRPVYIRNIS